MGAAVQQICTASFDMASRPIPPALAPYVRSWVGYVERSPHPLRRRELPGPKFVVILEFGPPIQVFESGSETRATRYSGGFVAGLDEQFSLTEHAGYQAGLELNLTPLGARVLFGVPASELARRVVSLTDVLPARKRAIAEHLANMPGWEQRFDVVERWLLDAVSRTAAQLRPAIWAAERIEARHGAVEIGGLCRELGYSHKHLLQLFREDVGLSPKAYARLNRFDFTIRQLRRSNSQLGWAELAHEAGYSDQSHLVREVKRFSGLTPTELARLVDGYPM